MEGKIRAFIAFDLDEGVKDRLRGIQERLRSKLIGAPIRWTRVSQMHFTLKFFASVSQSKLLRVFDSLKSSLRSEKPLEARFRPELGVFPSWKSPKVIWLGVDGDAEVRMKEFHRVLEEAYFKAGFPREEREFRAHLTLGRVKGRLRERELKILREWRLELGDVVLSDLVVFKSVLTPTGPIYTRLDFVRMI